VRFPLRMLLAFLLIVPACGRNEPRSTQAAPEERTNAREQSRNASEQSKNERDAYVKSVDARLSEFDQKLDGLDERAGAMTGATKTNFKKAIDGLRDQRKAVSTKVDDLKKVDTQDWTTMKGQVDSAMANLDRSYKQVSDMYEKNPATNPKAGSY
jgi:chromosome segregation ATPase